MPKVNYGGKSVTDIEIKTILENIARELNADVNVTSGDRGAVPKGGSKTSHHLAHRAADFWVAGMTLASAYQQIQKKAKAIFGKTNRYQVIHHGASTSTSGAHLHIGRYASGSGVKFCEEGLTKNTAGKYSCSSLTL